MIEGLLTWFRSIVNGVGDLANWLTQPFDLLGSSITPLSLVGIGGLLIFVGFAVVNWVVK